MSHTGSTMLGRIVANDGGVMFLGEIEALFKPRRKHHYEYIQKLSRDDKWSELLQCTVNSFYAKIFEKWPDKYMVVDCSKSPLWINARNSDCLKLGIKHRNVLIYKTPYELAGSYGARNKNWLRTFENYFKRYFYCVDEFYIIAYRDLLNNRSSLQKLCEHLAIPYFINKERYWENEVEEIFGSEKANRRRALTYEYDLTPNQEASVRETLEKNPVAAELWTVLERNRDQVNSSDTRDFKELSASKSELSLWAAANTVKCAYRRVFPKDYYKKRVVQ